MDLMTIKYSQGVCSRNSILAIHPEENHEMPQGNTERLIGRADTIPYWQGLLKKIKRNLKMTENLL
jgi:hypothetical protein